MRIQLANPRGFCAGVDRAVSIVERALELFGPPVYARHEIVHNRHVVDALTRRGAVFVDELSSVPDDATVIFSAHGVPPSVYQEATTRGLRFFDATCPLVTKVHLEIAARSRDGFAVLVIGHAGHAEVVGTMGYYDDARGGGLFLVADEHDAESVDIGQAERVAYVTQTTLSVTETAKIVAVLTRRFPTLAGPPVGDVCYATENRQQAVRVLAAGCPLVLVVGAPHSSNSQRMVEVGREVGAATYLIQTADHVRAEWLDGCDAVGVTSAASTPEHLVQEVVQRLQELRPGSAVDSFGEPENVVFRLPRDLRRMQCTVEG